MRHGDVGALTERSFLCPPCVQANCDWCHDLFLHRTYGLVACECDHGRMAS